MYKQLGYGLMGFFILMMFPATDQVIQQNLVYGGATLVAYDADSNEIFSQSIHNRLLDQGEQLINDAVFKDGVTIADATAIGAICTYVGGPALSSLIIENLTAAFFEGNNTNTGTTNCITDNAVDTSINSTAVIGPLTFNATAHVGADETVDGIGICGADSADAEYSGCSNKTILFAAVNTSDVTLAAGETVAITYTFDLVSPTD